MIIVTAAIIEKDGLILAARRKKDKHLAGYWEFPGGKLEPDESPEHCLARELREEFEVETSVGAFFDESVYDYDGKIVKLLAYLVRHKMGEFKLHDHDKIEWVSPENLSSVNWAPADIPLVKKYQAFKSTQKYYSNNAEEYCSRTADLSISEQYQLFLTNLPPGNRILDVGCGSGRDSREFINRGYKVTALDLNKKIAAFASKLIGQPVAVQSFLEMDFTAQFEGVWASASLLHCTRGQFQQAVARSLGALVEGGVMYLSVKKGKTEVIDEYGRYFNNHTKASLTALLREQKGLVIVKLWESPAASDAKKVWVQALIKKTRPNA